jgi:hypothetical protein
MEKLISEKEVTEKVTVKDISYKNDQRLEFFANTIIPSVAKHVNDFNARKKINGEEIEFLQETNQYLNDLVAITEKYAHSFRVETDVEINREEVIIELQNITAKIESLQNDPDIRYMDAMREFQAINEQKQKLESYILQAQKES